MIRHLLLAALLFATGSLPKALAQSTLYAVEESGPRGERINFVFLSEGYTSADLPNFAGHVNNAVTYLFSHEPWKQYRSYCNIYRIEIASAQSGCDNGSAGILRDTYFNSGFRTPSIPQLLTFDGTGQNRAYALLNQYVPEFSVPVLIVNDTKYGGSGGPIATASIHASGVRVVEHEIGHSFAGLGDEYDIDYPGYTPAERPNVTAQTSRNLVRWNAWVDTATPEPTPETTAYDALAGLFEGAMYRTTGWYRPHNNSLMRSLGRPVGQVNREQFVLSIYARVHLIEALLPVASDFRVDDAQRLNFSVTAKQPDFWALQTVWRIDGQVQGGMGGTGLGLDSYTLGNGLHTVSAEVADPTDFVRNDRNHLLQQTAAWNVTLSNQPSAILAAWRQAYFGTTSGGGNAGDTRDPDGDGQVNLIEFAFGTDPTVRQSRVIAFEGAVIYPGSPTVSVTNTLAGADFRAVYGRRKDYVAAGLNYRILFSADLGTWIDSTAPPTVAADDGVVEVLTVPCPSLVDGRTARFFRLVVSRL